MCDLEVFILLEKCRFVKGDVLFIAWLEALISVTDDEIVKEVKMVLSMKDATERIIVPPRLRSTTDLVNRNKL